MNNVTKEDRLFLLIQCINLLFLETQTQKGIHSENLISNVTDRMKEVNQNQYDEPMETNLKIVIDWIIKDKNENLVNKEQVIQKIRMVTLEKDYLLKALLDGIHYTDEKERDKAILSIRKQLSNAIKKMDIYRTFSKYSSEFVFYNPRLDYVSLIKEFVEKAEQFTKEIVDNKHPSIIESVDFTKPEEIEKILNEAKDEMSLDGILKTGWQGFNRMVGCHGGLRRGEFILVGGLQHNFKSGFVNTLFKQIALYNKPYLKNKKKKPLLLHITLENKTQDNVAWLYSNLKENETNEKHSINTTDVKEASDYISKELGKNGYHTNMLKMDGNNVTYHDLIDILLNYEQEGYEIHLVVCDYLAHLNRKGLNSNGAIGADLKDLFRRLRNFCTPKGITFLTPHQLSSEAKNLTRQGIVNLVTYIAGKGYYESCKGLDAEVDLEINIHKIEIDGKFYLLINRAKHRSVELTPKKYWFFILPFNDIGAIRDDINKDDTALYAIPKGSMNEEWLN